MGNPDMKVATPSKNNENIPVTDSDMHVKGNAPDLADEMYSAAEYSAPATTRRLKHSFDTAEHAMKSRVKGESEIELLAKNMEERKDNCISITFGERKEFLSVCYKVARAEGGSPSRFSKDGLQKLIEKYQERVSKKEDVVASWLYTSRNCFLNFLGYWDLDKSMLELLQAGMVYLENDHEHMFYYRDFNFYCLTIKTRFSFMRIPTLAICFWLFIFYLGSAILFCTILTDNGVCAGTSYAYEDWLSTVYFASVTMSTVGYGDVSLANGPSWQIFIGILFMLISVIVGACVFSAAAERTFGGLFGWDMLAWMEQHGHSNRELPLYKQIRRLVWCRVAVLTTYFVALNALGVFIARIVIYQTNDPAAKWNWMTTVYWAVQTTTTIGYGDLTMPFQLRWFNIFFTTFGTAFVGGVFGSLASLKSEITERRNYYAWRRREVSKHMIRELQVNDDKLDQYEFMVASLLLLERIKKSDVDQIMDKYRELVGENGFVTVEHDDEEESVDLEQEALGDETDFRKALLPGLSTILV